MSFRQLVGALTVIVGGMLWSCAPPQPGYAPGYRGGMVTSADSLATQAGLDILKKGGNAFDAAVTVGFVLAVTHPQAGNIGGGGFALIYVVDSSKVYALDFRETAPHRASRDMYLDNDGEAIDQLSTKGFLASGTPGTVAGLLEILNCFGSLPRTEIMQPAIDLAESGFIVDSALAARFANYAESFAQFASTRKYFLQDGQPFTGGDTLIQADLARVLKLIAEKGKAGFYSGETAGRLATEMSKHGGLIDEFNLASYQAVWREPIQFDYSRLTIYSISPPSSGGVIMGEIFGILANFEISGRQPTDPWYIHLLTESCRLAYADRSVYLGDPDFAYNPTELLLSQDYLYTRSRQIDTTQALPSIRVGAGLEVKESESTTHYCVIDSAGNIVSLTYTINSNFGCKQVVNGLGFFMNNEMDDFSIKPGMPNQFGLIGGEANAIAPGKRMLSSMSPTIVFYNDRPTMIVGTPGGSKIITSVTATILNFFGFGMSLDSAINLPHYHHQWLPDKLYYEKGAFDTTQIRVLTDMGHNLQQRSDYGDLQVIVIQPDGSYVGASDRRGNGYAAGY
ncbi:MAG: gamma-glutamyltransferase [candidate division Zixibacteria bacterium]|nr:gamma-glutamyltransferase [candidate division Zixibacteria bacterium]